IHRGTRRPHPAAVLERYARGTRGRQKGRSGPSARRPAQQTPTARGEGCAARKRSRRDRDGACRRRPRREPLPRRT
ncbi:MAG: hypothetical protein ACK55Z_25470, partial [bacterium]